MALGLLVFVCRLLPHRSLLALSSSQHSFFTWRHSFGDQVKSFMESGHAGTYQCIMKVGPSPSQEASGQRPGPLPKASWKRETGAAHTGHLQPEFCRANPSLGGGIKAGVSAPHCFHQPGSFQPPPLIQTNPSPIPLCIYPERRWDLVPESSCKGRHNFPLSF